MARLKLLPGLIVSSAREKEQIPDLFPIPSQPRVYAPLNITIYYLKYNCQYDIVVLYTVC